MAWASPHSLAKPFRRQAFSPRNRPFSLAATVIFHREESYNVDLRNSCSATTVSALKFEFTRSWPSGAPGFVGGRSYRDPRDDLQAVREPDRRRSKEGDLRCGYEWRTTCSRTDRGLDRQCTQASPPHSGQWNRAPGGGSGQRDSRPVSA